MQSRIVQRLTALRPAAHLTVGSWPSPSGRSPSGRSWIAILEQWTGDPRRLGGLSRRRRHRRIGGRHEQPAVEHRPSSGFLVYDILFTEPRLSLIVADPIELLNLILVLIVALAVGRLAALGRERAAEADRRAIEATGQFAVSRLLATADATEGGGGPDRRAAGPRRPARSRLDRGSPAASAGESSRIRARAPSPAAASSPRWSGPPGETAGPPGPRPWWPWTGPRHAQEGRADGDGRPDPDRDRRH